VFVYATLQHPETNHCTVSIRHSLDIRTVGAHRLPRTPPSFIADNAGVLAAYGIDASASTREVYTKILAAEARLADRQAHLHTRMPDAREGASAAQAAAPTDTSGWLHHSPF